MEIVLNIEANVEDTSTPNTAFIETSKAIEIVIICVQKLRDQSTEGDNASLG